MAKVKSGKLKSKTRNKLPDSAFCLPKKRKYPCTSDPSSKSHCQSALRLKGHASPSEQKQIERCVCARQPDLGFCQDRRRARKQ